MTALQTQWAVTLIALCAPVLLILWLHERQERVEWERLARQAALTMLAEMLDVERAIEQEEEEEDADIGEDVEDLDPADGQDEPEHGPA